MVKPWCHITIGYMKSKQRPIFFLRPPDNEIPFSYNVVGSPNVSMFSIKTLNDDLLNYLNPVLRSFVDKLVSNNFKVDLRSYDLKCALDGCNYADTKLIYSTPKAVFN